MYWKTHCLLAVLALTVLSTILINCGQEDATVEGDFCEGQEDCQGDLICEMNVCIQPPVNLCEPPCNPEVEACYRNDCVVIADADDKDLDGTPVGEDCDDYDWTRYPGAHEYCDGVDNDCDSQTDEDCPACEEGRTQKCGTDVGECTQG